MNILRFTIKLTTIIISLFPPIVNDFGLKNNCTGFSLIHPLTNISV